MPHLAAVAQHDCTRQANEEDENCRNVQDNCLLETCCKVQPIVPVGIELMVLRMRLGALEKSGGMTLIGRSMKIKDRVECEGGEGRGSP